MDDQQRRQDQDRTAQGAGDRGFPKPVEDGAMDPAIQQTTTRGDATTGIESDIPGVDAHGAAEGERDRPEPGSEAQQLAQQSAERAFPPAEDARDGGGS